MNGVNIPQNVLFVFCTNGIIFGCGLVEYLDKTIRYFVTAQM